MSEARNQQRELLRTAGLRVTGPRLAVLDVLSERAHLTADEILTEICERFDRAGSASVQAVYDVVNVLTERGLLRRIEPAGSATRYERRVGDNHHHLVCRGCGAVTDVSCTVGAAPCLTPFQAHGFEVDEAEITFWGVCQQCRRAVQD